MAVLPAKPPSNEEKDGDVAPAQTPTLVKGGAKSQEGSQASLGKVVRVTLVPFN